MNPSITHVYRRFSCLASNTLASFIATNLFSRRLTPSSSVAKQFKTLAHNNTAHTEEANHTFVTELRTNKQQSFSDCAMPRVWLRTWKVEPSAVPEVV